MKVRLMQLKPLSGALGATIHGIDLPSSTPDQWDQIRTAFLEHLVLFFPDQKLDAQRLVTVGAGFGEPTFYPFIEGVPEEPRVIPLISTADGVVRRRGRYRLSTTASDPDGNPVTGWRRLASAASKGQASAVAMLTTF